MSLDTLRRDRFVALARFDELDARQGGHARPRTASSARFKIDTVVIKGVNDDELVDLDRVRQGRSSAEVRFIEYMDVGGATQWSPAHVDLAAARCWPRSPRATDAIEPIVEPASSAPADRFALPDGTTFGIISSTTDPFCRSCDRSRLTADGMWYLCLYATDGLDLREGASVAAPAWMS